MRGASAGVAALALAAAACGGAGAPAQRLSIATGNPGGVYYVLGGAYAQVLGRSLPGTEATAEVTSASVENLRFVARKSADVAFTLADTADDAARGRGRFEAPLPIRTLAAVHTNLTHVVVREGGPATVAALRGRRVSTGSPNSGTEVIADRLLRAAGLDPARDVTRERLGVAESAAALKDGTVDAFFWSAGVPTPAVLELASTPGVKIRLLDHGDLLPALVSAHGPLYAAASIPERTYPGVPAAQVTAVRNLLVVHAEMPDELAYALVKALLGAREELAAVHPAAREIEPRSAASGSPVPYHPGAVRYFREAGVWPGR